MRIPEICTTEVVCCRPQASALDAARLMRHKHVGDVVVVSDPEGDRVPVVDQRGTLVGIVTLDDLLRALLSDMQTLLASQMKAQRREQSSRR